MKTYGWECETHRTAVSGFEKRKTRNESVNAHVNAHVAMFGETCDPQVTSREEESRSGSIVATEAEIIRNLTTENDALARECAARANESDRYRRDRDDLATAVNTLTAEKRALQEEWNALAVENHEVWQKHEQLREERDIATAALTEMARERDAARRTLHEVNLIRHSCPPPLGNPTREEAIAALREIASICRTYPVDASDRVARIYNVIMRILNKETS